MSKYEGFDSELTVQNENSLQVDGKIYSLDTAPDYKDPLVQKEVGSAEPVM
jgi:hypothetical protein